MGQVGVVAEGVVVFGGNASSHVETGDGDGRHVEVISFIHGDEVVAHQVHVAGGLGLGGDTVGVGTGSHFVVRHKGAERVRRIVCGDTQAVQRSRVGAGSRICVHVRLAVSCKCADAEALAELIESRNGLELAVFALRRTEHERHVAVGLIDGLQRSLGFGTVVVDDRHDMCVGVLRHNLAIRRHSF